MQRDLPGEARVVDQHTYLDVPAVI